MLSTLTVGLSTRPALSAALGQADRAVRTGGEALTLAGNPKYDVIYVASDIEDMAPEEFITEVRGAGISTPIIALMTYFIKENSVQIGCRCLRAGADDFVMSWHDLKWSLEVEARTEAVLRRCKPSKPAFTSYGPTTLNVGEKTCVIDGHPVRFTGRQFDIMLALVKARGTVATIGGLMGIIYEAHDRPRGDTTIKVQVNNIRNKIAEATGGDPKHYLKTKKGFHQGRGDGYFLIGENDGKQDMGYDVSDLRQMTKPSDVSESEFANNG